ncbi:hepatocyte cell adhesion molecule isoform X2 [Oreochromis niloticus]|uniref:hepatocyte cell adhesion molecule isoform X2 n=1 Tax=Oreochromis niloticus TaxID=8128 RepID=UPI000674E31B|nr:hepatocyte cell adhesion molecule isoform X2 [Oreochromis niloticus]
MKAVAGLLLMFGVCHGVETYCDGRQDGAQCYGALGGTVDIQLMDSTSEIPRIQLLKNSLVILFVRNNKVISNTIKHRSLLFPSNGTFKINNLSRNDSGNYSFITFNSDGKASDEQTLHLFVQAPVSSALLVSECLSQGEMRVSCSSEGGDSPQYSWTLDGRTLTDAELLSVNNESNIITLRQHVSGRLVCSVRNSVSSVSKEERISTCGHLPLIGGVLSALVFFIVVGVAVICAQRKKQNNKPTKQKEDDQEVTYADVRVMKQQGKRVEQTAQAEAEVEYGQVKFSKRPRHTELRGDDCMYAKVHKVR